MKKIVFGCWLYFLCASLVFGQGITQTYIVTDWDNFPLPGVAVKVNNQLQGLSDADGTISISAAKNDSISFQLIGYGPLSINFEQQPKAIVVQLQPSITMLETVAVVGRRDELARELPYLVETVNAAKIELLQSRSSADALADLSGVYVQKSQFGGGSPIVRGFEANRVLLVVDGVRMNNAIFRNGHLQNAITIDVNALNSMELIYGPGSLAYGSDALGGVIHFRTHSPAFQERADWKVNAALNYASASKSKNFSLGLEYGNERFASYTQVSLGDFGNLKAGSNRPERYPDFGERPFYISRINGQDSVLTNTDPDLQIGTAYKQIDLLQKLHFKLVHDVELKANFQFSTSSDVPRYDNLTEVRNDQLRWAEWYYGPQNRLLGSLRLDDRRARKLFDFHSLILSHQFIEEDRISRRNGSPFRENSEVDVHSSNFQWDFAKFLNNEKQLRYGIDARHDKVYSDAFLFDLEEERVLDFSIPTRYPSAGSSLTTMGLYVDYKHPINRQLTAQAGLRLNQQWLKATFGAYDPIEWPAAYLDGIKNSATALTAAASLRYQHRGHRLRLLFAQGFRSPNIDDFAKFRERNGFIQVPNPDLDSERSNSLELGYDRHFNDWQLWLVGYHTWLNDAIVRDAFLLPDGSDSFVSFGDTLRVQANINADKARIFGIDAGLKKKFTNGLGFSTEVHWLKGIRSQLLEDGTNIEVPQDHIPPLYGNFSVSYENKHWSAALRLRFQAAKRLEDYAVSSVIILPDGFLLDRSGTSDNLDLTPKDPETGAFTGSYGWSTLNFNTQFKLNKHIKLNFGIENIFDQHYRTFASGVSAPGRNFLLGISFLTL